MYFIDLWCESQILQNPANHEKILSKHIERKPQGHTIIIERFMLVFMYLTTMIYECFFCGAITNYSYDSDFPEARN